MLTLKVLLKSHQLDPFNLLFYASTGALVLIFPLWFMLEGWSLLTASFELSRVTGAQLMWLYLLNGIAHFGQNIFAFVTLKLGTQPLTTKCIQ